MDTAAALNQFLAGVEQRAFARARLAVRNPDDALDIVQEAMLTLARRYSARPQAEWAPLFHRILQNQITDHHRRQAVRNRIFGWFRRSPSGASEAGQEPDLDPVALAPGPTQDEPERRLMLAGATRRMVAAVQALPPRQQQAFLLRAWDGLDVAATAAAMGCSQGSVKTHYSRAVHSLRGQLEDDWS